MAARWYPIPADAHAALSTSTAYEGPRVIITEQLGPEVWPGVKTVLEKLGAVYALGTSAFDFEPDQDARGIVTAALAAGRVMAAAQADGFVPTPADLAADLVSEYAELRAPHGRKLRVLEPSAGTGRFVAAITREDDIEPMFAEWRWEWLDVTAVEPDARRARQIPTAGGAVSVVVDTFEVYARRAKATGQRFDVIVMNPPFATPGHASLWAEHLTAAWDLLAPGGRLVAIVPASVRHVTRGPGERARVLAHSYGGVEDLEADAFAESGIKIPTSVVWLDKPLRDHAPDGWAPPLTDGRFPRYTGTETPVPVDRLYLTRAAATSTPVQVWRDGWRNAERVLRFAGTCLTCERPTWAFDDGENDPRGPLGEASAGGSLDPYEYGHADTPGAEPVVLCFTCSNEADTYERAMTTARQMWADAFEAHRAAQAAREAELRAAWGEPMTAAQRRAERTEMLGELVDGCATMGDFYALARELRGLPPVAAPADDAGTLDDDAALWASVSG